MADATPPGPSPLEERVRATNVDALLKHFGTITDGKWEPRKDIRALLYLGGVALGYLSAAHIALKAAGIY